MVGDAEHHSKGHVDDPNDDGHLHLVGVQEGQTVHRQVPDLMLGRGTIIFVDIYNITILYMILELGCWGGGEGSRGRCPGGRVR